MKKFLFALLLAIFSDYALSASNTTYDPATFSFDADKIAGFGQGVSANCGANTTTDIDLTLSDDAILTGAIITVVGATAGDYVDVKVMTGSTVLATPIQSWYIPTTGSVDYQMVIPKKVASGLKLRVTVTTTGLLATPFVAVNWKLWKVLI